MSERPRDVSTVVNRIAEIDEIVGKREGQLTWKEELFIYSTKMQVYILSELCRQTDRSIERDAKTDPIIDAQAELVHESLARMKKADKAQKDFEESFTKMQKNPNAKEN